MRAWAALLALVFVLAGCAGKDSTSNDTSTTDGADGNSSTTSHSTTTSRTTTGTSTTKDDHGTNHEPSATLGVSVSSGAPPLAVNFTLGGADPDGDALTWTLDYGDGSTADAGSTLPAGKAHSFTAAGNFTVTFTVTDSRKAKAEKTQAITVKAGASAGPQVVEGEWTAGGPSSCVQGFAGGDVNQLLTPLDGIEFVTFDVEAATVGKDFFADVRPTAPAAGPFEIDFYDGGGANLGYFQSTDEMNFDISGQVPTGAVQAVFFPCVPGGGDFTYTAPGTAPAA